NATRGYGVVFRVLDGDGDCQGWWCRTVGDDVASRAIDCGYLPEKLLCPPWQAHLTPLQCESNICLTAHEPRRFSQALPRDYISSRGYNIFTSRLVHTSAAMSTASEDERDPPA